MTVASEGVDRFSFTNVSLADLDGLSPDDVDGLSYGVVGLSRDGIVEVYNATESRMAGLPVDAVVGSAFFLSTAQCMNNFMVAQRLEDESEIDAMLPYVLTFRMRPTPVTLRLLKTAAIQRSYLLIRR